MTKDDWEVWKQISQTKEYFRDLERRVEELKDHFADGRTTMPESVEGTALRTAGVVGEIKGLRWAMTIEFDEEK